MPQTATRREIEAALDRLALAMEKAGNNGPAYLPIFDRLEAELAVMTATEDRMTRVRLRLMKVADVGSKFDLQIASVGES